MPRPSVVRVPREGGPESGKIAAIVINCLFINRVIVGEEAHV